MKLKTRAAIACIAVIVVACGGGGSDLGSLPAINPGGGGTGGTTASTGVPASVFQSVDTFIAYVRGLSPDETSEPSTLPDLVAPSSDTSEPAA